ncbi:MAG TPA: hypothetical protein VFG48_04735 [Xanthomonadales bacterium]|nr:hypothetical protein [Xanthomonadales bacterium]
MTRMVLALMISAVPAVFLGPLSAGSVAADVLLIEEVRQAERMTLPVNGMKQAEVRERFGAPVKTDAPVGDPPITRWDYDGYSVYFEYDLVLFTVLHKGQVLDEKRS